MSQHIKDLYMEFYSLINYYIMKPHKWQRCEEKEDGTKIYYNQDAFWAKFEEYIEARIKGEKNMSATTYVPELDMFSKSDDETQSQYIMNALISRLSREVSDAHMKYMEAYNKYQSIMRLIEAYKDAKD